MTRGLPVPNFNDRLLPVVSEYASEQFHLSDDLNHLDAVRCVGAFEATIFYASRILERLAGDALRTCGIPASANMLSNLILLQQLNLISPVARYCAHHLRRSGNAVRHITKQAHPQDGDLALELLNRLLKWFFCDLRSGYRLTTITVDQKPIWQVEDSNFHAILESIDHPQIDPVDLTTLVERAQTRALRQTPFIPALLGEILLDHEQNEAARTVLYDALALFPDDLRLQQLMGLCCNRSGEPKTALAYVEPLRERFADDEETAGILGGIYKSLWRCEVNEIHWLSKSHAAYRRGWERSGFTNAYVGINVATTTLWLGRLSESREAARRVRDLLRQRIDAVLARSDLRLDYWDQASLAEAELLSGNLSIARHAYREAFDAFKSQSGSIQVTYQQLGEVLPHLGLRVSADQFLTRRSFRSMCPAFVGVIGHRNLPTDQGLSVQIELGLRQLLHLLHGSRQIRPVILSALAEGADRLLADLVLSPAFAGALQAVMPLEVTDYCHDFTTPASLQEFFSLITQAESIVFPRDFASENGSQRIRDIAIAESLQEGRNAAYEGAGRYIVDRSDAIVTIWDGAEGRGRGGTAELVSYARQFHKPLLWVRSFPPYEWTLEGIR